MATTKIKVPSQKMTSHDKDVLGEKGTLVSGDGEGTARYHSSSKSKESLTHTTMWISPKNVM